jgi:hypothetical protein
MLIPVDGRLSTLLGHTADGTDRPLRRDCGRCNRHGVCL